MASARKHQDHSKSIADYLPELNRLLSQDTVASTAKKKPRPTNYASIHQTTSCKATLTEKYKPRTIAQMQADLEGLKTSTRKPQKTNDFTQMRQRWNSSVKVDKKKNLTSDGKLQHHPVRKALNFQSKSAPIRTTMAGDSIKFPKPESRAKKFLGVRNTKEVRISGVYKLPDTPEITARHPVTSRMIVANKENLSPPKNQFISVQMKRKKGLTPKGKPKVLIQPETGPCGDTLLSNDSWKSSCDASFIQKEKEINEVEKGKTVFVQTNIQYAQTQATPPVSTPFKEYRNVQEYFNNSSEMEDSMGNNTIMCFDKQTGPEQTLQLEQSLHRALSNSKTVAGDKNEDSVIATLCDLFTKATVDNEQPKSELDILLEMKKDTENNIRAQIKLLKYINRLIQQKNISPTKNVSLNVSKILMLSAEVGTASQELKPFISKPVYKIPRKNPVKKFCKSMPDMPSIISPMRDSNNKALNMYMEMKAHMDFLTTPVRKRSQASVPDTPALTSHNLQQQLDKLFSAS